MISSNLYPPRLHLPHLAVLTTALTMTLSAQAAPAIFTDGEMTIPEGATINQDGQGSYYTDIRLAAESDGSLRITSANTNPLVTVEDVQTNISDSVIPEFSVTVSGYLSNPCVTLLSPAISYESGDGVIEVNIVLAESLLGPAETCIAVTEPFTTTIDLELEGDPGDAVAIKVHDIDTGFVYP